MHRYIWSLIVVYDGSQLHLLIHCCICWLTTHLLIHRASGGSQLYFLFYRVHQHLLIHSCILRLIVASADLLLNLVNFMVYRCICCHSVAFLLVPSGICWSKVAFGDHSLTSADSQLHLQVHSCIGWFRVAPAHAQWHAACWFTGSCGGLHLRHWWFTAASSV